MKLKESDQVWVPADLDQYLLVLPKGEAMARDPDLFLQDQARLLRRLVAEASDTEIDQANLRLSENLPQSESLWLPSDLLRNPATPGGLMGNPAELGSQLHQWKEGVAAALKMPSLPAAQARKLAEGLSLESFLSRLL